VETLYDSLIAKDMEKLFSLLEPLIWLGIAEYVKLKYGSSLHLPLNRATCDITRQSSLLALLNSLFLMARSVFHYEIPDSSDNYFADKTGLAFGSSAAGLLFVVVLRHKLGFDDDTTSDIGKYYAFMVSHTGYAFSLTTFLFTLTKLVYLRKNDTFSAVEVLPMTYIVCMCRSVYNIIQKVELGSEIIFLFAAFSMTQISLWLLYKDLLGFDKSDTTRKDSLAKEIIPRSGLQYAFTAGEWVVISAFISILLTDYFLRYVTSNGDISASDLSPDLIVSQAGVIGCLIGVFISRAQIILKLCRVATKHIHLGRKNNLVRSLLPISIVVYTTIFFVSVSLTQYCKETTVNVDFCSKESLFDNNLYFMALPFRWLIGYILQYEYHLYYNRYRSVLRLSIILYWTIMIVLCIIAGVIIGKKIDAFSGIERKRVIIVARKYFHLVAIALFYKPTLLAPSMMGLSYAVATSLLILVENIRWDYESTTTIRKYSEVVANGTLRPTKSFITQFFELFFDEKDERAKEGGFVITHISLLCGCAMPLWIHLLYPSCSLTPFLGIICVGVGDAAGAVVGTYYGQHKWPDKRRSIEGSFAMLVSISIVTFFLLRSYDLDMRYDIAILVLTVLTLMEAVTYQLDNICLPLLSVILFYAFDCT